ncbi:MAG: S-methyl-5-thioribose-1-phosphate isomerase [Candidatus Bathyarchaeota archaeon]|nr:S-methyl-5-thioribose-1-phosphate isomerase [Candidatus Bathyarchaeota archaeon]
MNPNLQDTAERIRKLQVQGARNVAIAAIQALETLAQQTSTQTRKAFLSELYEARSVLFQSRETEPLMRNAVQWVITQVEDSDERNVIELAHLVSKRSQGFQKDLEASKQKIAEIGSRRIQNGAVVFTHCHSSTVTNLLAKAKQQGKTFQVICTETRPAFQGRLTAKELTNLGIETTFIVDSAAQTFLPKADLVLVGADAITSEGNIINKIGTAAIALIAREAKKPLYSVTELLKYDPQTLQGETEKIEYRNPNEIWTDPPKNLNIQNPAFDLTQNYLISALITEQGIIPPQTITQLMQQTHPWLFH